MKRYSIFPIEKKDLWDRYKAAQSQFWIAEEVDLSQDKWDKLTEDERRVLKQILGFFTVSDGIVMENIATSFISTVEEPEAEFYYGQQLYIEGVHAELYGLFIESYIKNESEKAQMFTPIESMETVKKKAQWALKWLNSESFEERLIAFSVIEGIFFSLLFSYVFYFRQGGLMPGLCSGNELIFRDENGHYEFAVHYYKNHTSQSVPKERIKEIILEALEIEKTFNKEVLITGLPGLTSTMMEQYVEYVADTVLTDYGIPKVFNVSQPLAYMDRILLDSRSNFFERRSTSYSRVSSSDSLIDEDF